MAIEENPFDHILYEFSMYLLSYPIDTGISALNNLKVDSHLVHLRNLAYFFDKKKNCDIHASNYVNDPASIVIETKLLKDIYYRTNCAACHMSKERLDPDFKKKTLDCEIAAFSLFLPIIERYLDLLDNNLKPAFAEQWKSIPIQAEAKTVRASIIAWQNSFFPPEKQIHTGE